MTLGYLFAMVCAYYMCNYVVKTMPTSNNSPHLTTTTGYCDDCVLVGETRPLALCRDAYTFMQGEIARQMEIKTGRRDDRSELQRVFEDEEKFFDMVQ